MKHIGNLKKAHGSTHRNKRIGRGEGSGYGGTATRGHKGQKSRSGMKQARGFEGGQMPLNRRIPKFGFNNNFRIEYYAVNVSRLQELADKDKIKDEVNAEILLEIGVIRNLKKPLKILGDGEISAKLNVTADRFTESAKQKIESAGGTVTTNA